VVRAHSRPWWSVSCSLPSRRGTPSDACETPPCRPARTREKSQIRTNRKKEFLTSSSSMSQDVLMVSLSSEYFHLDKSYLPLLAAICALAFSDLSRPKQNQRQAKSQNINQKPTPTANNIKALYLCRDYGQLQVTIYVCTATISRLPVEPGGVGTPELGNSVRTVDRHGDTTQVRDSKHIQTGEYCKHHMRLDKIKPIDLAIC